MAAGDPPRPMTRKDEAEAPVVPAPTNVPTTPPQPIARAPQPGPAPGTPTNGKKTTGKLKNPPEIISKGFVFVRDSEKLFAEVQARVTNAFSQSGNSASLAPEKLADKLQRQLADFFYNETRRRPMVFALVNEV